MTRTESKGLVPGVLYWSEQGEISCAKHAPYRGSDTWRWERWRPMGAADRLETVAHRKSLGITPTNARCETCECAR